jgi:DNA repair protein RecN (Recombination protein N)
LIEDIRVRGVGGIREAELSLKGDFIVITGESGSGKSSLVRAMEFIAGKRAQTNYIHALEESADVLMTLSTDHIACLDEEYQPQEGTLIVRRQFSRTGRGRCMVQNNPLSLNLLSSAMEKELVIQSQFAQLGLIDPAIQLDLVDSCGGEILDRTKRELERTFSETIATERQILRLKKRREETEELYQDAEAALRLISALEIEEDSERKWEAELKELESKETSAEALTAIYQRLSGGTACGGAIEELESIARDIYGSSPSKREYWQESIEKMLVSSQSVSRLLQKELQDLASEGNIEEAKERLEKKIGMLRKLKRSLDLVNCRQILEYSARATNEIQWLKESHMEQQELEREAAEKKKETKSMAMELRKLRKAAASELASRVNAHLRDLAMEHALFSIDIEEQDKLRSNGAEAVSFKLSMPDQQPLPVGRTASGGELSRILIALQLSLGDEQLPGTLVFDEVEAGLGGRTALLAGYKLRELSKRCRTILITHEAAIASMADQHFLVKRDGDETNILPIRDEDREKEIARMLAGDDNSHEALEHARSLLYASHNGQLQKSPNSPPLID